MMKRDDDDFDMWTDDDGCIVYYLTIMVTFQKEDEGDGKIVFTEMKSIWGW